MPSSTLTQNTNTTPPPPSTSTSTSRTKVSSTNATSVTDGPTTPRHLPARAQPPINGLSAQDQAAGARRDEFLRGIGAWTEARSPEPKMGNVTAVVGAGMDGKQACDSHYPEQGARASAKGGREGSFGPMERLRREFEREEPFGGKRE